jgi:hypothetical protein
MTLILSASEVGLNKYTANFYQKIRSKKEHGNANLDGRIVFEWILRNAMRSYCSVYSRCYATTTKGADIPGPFLGIHLVNTFPLLGSRFLNATIGLQRWNNCVFYGPCLDVISKGQG